MAYLKKECVPAHWRSIRSIPGRPPSRRGQKYCVTMHPGKPASLSVPLILVLKRYLNDPLITTSKLKRYHEKVLINGKKPKDLRAPLAIGDLLQIGANKYRFLFEKKDKMITYRLENLKLDQHCIRRVLSSSGGPVLETMTGMRIPHSVQKPLLPGSILSQGKIYDLLSGQVKTIIALTGRKKYESQEIKSVRLQDDKLRVSMMDDKYPDLLLTEEDFLRRRYLTLL